MFLGRKRILKTTENFALPFCQILFPVQYLFLSSHCLQNVIFCLRNVIFCGPGAPGQTRDRGRPAAQAPQGQTHQQRFRPSPAGIGWSSLWSTETQLRCEIAIDALLKAARETVDEERARQHREDNERLWKLLYEESWGTVYERHWPNGQEGPCTGATWHHPQGVEEPQRGGNRCAICGGGRTLWE